MLDSASLFVKPDTNFGTQTVKSMLKQVNVHETSTREPKPKGSIEMNSKPDCVQKTEAGGLGEGLYTKKHERKNVGRADCLSDVMGGMLYFINSRKHQSKNVDGSVS